MPGSGINGEERMRGLGHTLRDNREKVMTQIRRISEAYLYLLKMVLIVERNKDTHKEREHRKISFLSVPFVQHQSPGRLCKFDKRKSNTSKYIYISFSR